MALKVFGSAYLGKDLLKNRIIRAPTYEGLCGADGIPTESLKRLYVTFAKNDVGAIITGFSTVSRDGRSTMSGHNQIDCDAVIAPYRDITRQVHHYGCKIYMQIVHQGRNTSSKACGGKIYSASGRPQFFFRPPVHALSISQIEEKISDFGDAAMRAKRSGFDGVEVHAAHGNLIHDFILSSANKRKDKFGINRDTKIGTRFLNRVIHNIRNKCGDDFTLIVKISASTDYINSFTQNQLINLIRFLDASDIDAIEVGYGTLDHALNIMRGESIPVEAILNHSRDLKTQNPFKRFFFKQILLPLLTVKIKPFARMYNLPYAEMAKQYTAKQVITVGGFRTGEEIRLTLERRQADFVSLSRPFICEPDFARKIKSDEKYSSQCINCNICTVMTESPNATRCYHRKNLTESQNN